jgi:6-phosphogluconate dehydrogenase
MELGMIGLGRMGASMVRRLQRLGHKCVVYDRAAESVRKLASEGAVGASSLEQFVQALPRPRLVWMMVPAAAVDAVVDELASHLDEDDIVVDGGNSHFGDDIQRAKRLGARGIHYLDCGVSGGVWGLERGYCLMIGGDGKVVGQVEPILAALAPGAAAAPDTPGRSSTRGTAHLGYLHCGGPGAGHFVKMVHNAIEYGLMAAYAEGFNILAHSGAGAHPRPADAETSPLREPDLYRYEFDIAEIAEVWRRGSVVASWLLDLSAQALVADPSLERFDGRVSDSGEGRWTLAAANDLSVPAHVLAASLFQRFSSRGEADFQNRMLSALRFAFGGHLERPAP